MSKLKNITCSLSVPQCLKNLYLQLEIDEVQLVYYHFNFHQRYRLNIVYLQKKNKIKYICGFNDMRITSIQIINSVRLKK